VPSARRDTRNSLRQHTRERGRRRRSRER
jgi:hypothetical protein